MPRKARDIEIALMAKGFEKEEARKHVFFIYLDEDGKQTVIRTHLSYQAGGTDVSENLLGKMAKQVNLESQDFRRLIDCPMSNKDYAERIRLKGE